MKHNQKALSFLLMAAMFSSLVGCGDKFAVSEYVESSLDEPSTSLELVDLNDSQKKVMTCDQLCQKVAKDNNSPVLLQELISPTEYRCDIRSAKVYFSVPDECVVPPKPSCSELCDKMAKDNDSPVLLKGLISQTEYRCEIRGAKIYYSVPEECSATYEPACEVGLCKSLGARVNYFVPASELKVRVLSGKALEIFGGNRSDLSVIVHKGASAIYSDQPATNKRVYFEGLAKDYSFNVSGNVVQVKDSCGVISQMTIGQDLKVKMIFQDGTQEIVLVPGANGTFRFVLDGVQKTLVSLGAGEFMQAGYNYMNVAETSKPHFAQACGD